MLLVTGDITRRTGGNLYDLRMQRACARAGVRLRIVSVRSTAQARSELARLRPRVIVIDSIALRLVAPLLPWMRGQRSRVVALMHMRTSAPGTRAVLRAADRIVAVSPHLARTLVRSGAKRSRIAVIPPGSDGIMPVSRARRRNDPKLHVLAVANWSRTKGIATLVAAAAHIPEVRLDLVGETGGAHRDEVMAIIRSRRLGDRVVVHGALKGGALARRYVAADVFALPSEREGYGTVFAEALTCGLPVIAGDVEPVRTLVGDAGLFVPPGRVRPLVSALRLVSDPWLRRRLASSARVRARALPSWARTEAAFVSLVESEVQATVARG